MHYETAPRLNLLFVLFSTGQLLQCTELSIPIVLQGNVTAKQDKHKHCEMQQDMQP